MSSWLSRALKPERRGSRYGELKSGRQEQESDGGMMQAEEFAFSMYKVNDHFGQ